MPEDLNRGPIPDPSEPPSASSPGMIAQAKLREERWREIEATWEMLADADVATLTGDNRRGLISVDRPSGRRYPAFQLVSDAEGTKVVAPAWAELQHLLAPTRWSDANILLWAASPNAYLEGLTPADEVQRHPDEVTEALRAAVASALPSK